MKRMTLIWSGLLGVALFATAADDRKPIFPAPKSTPKFKEVEVRVAHEPTLTPLQAESLLQWRTERELVSRKEPNFKVGKKGLVISIKFLTFIAPQEPMPRPRPMQTVPNARGGQMSLGLEAQPMPVPPLGEARILITFSEADGTVLSQFDIAQPVKSWKRMDDEDNYVVNTARIAAAYARYYFLEKPDKPATLAK